MRILHAYIINLSAAVMGIRNCCILFLCILIGMPVLRECIVQDELPCLTEEGKIILETREGAAMAPNGNGGLFLAMTKQVLLLPHPILMYEPNKSPDLQRSRQSGCKSKGCNCN